jgi:hypothetical protein
MQAFPVSSSWPGSASWFYSFLHRCHPEYYISLAELCEVLNPSVHMLNKITLVSGSLFSFVLRLPVIPWLLPHETVQLLPAKAGGFLLLQKF